MLQEEFLNLELVWLIFILNNLGYLENSKDLVQTITNKIGVITDEHLWIFDRFISWGFYALVEYSKVIPRLNNILDESCKWYSVKELPTLAIDHAEIIQKRNYARPQIGWF
jgi:hypothetical protein